MTSPSRVKQVSPPEFFVLRSPLLPLEILWRWSEGLRAPGALSESDALAHAIAADTVTLRSRLQSILSRPDLREAVFLASPDLHARLDVWWRNPESKAGRRVELALVRYFVRAAARATPFGLFAGVSTGHVAGTTKLSLPGQSAWRRHTRLGFGYLASLCEALARSDGLHRRLVYHPNGCLHHLAGRIRYAQCRPSPGGVMSDGLASIEETELLAIVLDRARGGRTLADLAQGLADHCPSPGAADEYVRRLVDAQLLISELEPPVTGPEPLAGVIETLGPYPEAKPAADRLRAVQRALELLDAEPLGISPDRYARIAETLRDLPASADRRRFFHVDLYKPAPALSLGPTMLAEILRGAELLHFLTAQPVALASAGPAAELAAFREAFVARYHEGEIPLTTALDEEHGIDWREGHASREAAPLLEGLKFPLASLPEPRLDDRASALLSKVMRAVSDRQTTIELSGAELDSLGWDPAAPMPDAFSVVATLAARDAAELNEGKFLVYVSHISGTAGSWCGRFCHGDHELCEAVQRHLHSQEASRSDAIFAEIVYLLDAGVGDLVARPVLRDFEIPLRGRSGAASERQISVADLLVSVVGDRVVLRSATLGREVVPCLASALNPRVGQNLALYRFLCSLVAQHCTRAHTADLWGALSLLPFLPRLVSGRIILALARWRIGDQEVQALDLKSTVARFRAVQEWRAQRLLPRWVTLTETDNKLVVDLDNVLCIEGLIRLLKQQGGGTLEELFPPPDQTCVSGPEGHFAHELVVPFVRNDAAKRVVRSSGPRSAAMVPVRFPPGSEWLYVKLYLARGAADPILRAAIGPVARQLVATGLVDRWFFVRYQDPDFHLRIRFHGEPRRLLSDTLPALSSALAGVCASGAVRRTQLDSYEPEVDRYGGLRGMAIAEEVFTLDSEAVLSLLELTGTHGGAEARWRLTLCGIDALLSAFDLDLQAKLTIATRCRATFGDEGAFAISPTLRRQVAAKYRHERQGLESLLRGDPGEDERMGQGLKVLAARSEALKPLSVALRDCEHAGELTKPVEGIVASYLHMFVNRMQRGAFRKHESVLYDFLRRHYESRLARARRPGPEDRNRPLLLPRQQPLEPGV